MSILFILNFFMMSRNLLYTLGLSLNLSFTLVRYSMASFWVSFSLGPLLPLAGPFPGTFRLGSATFLTFCALASLSSALGFC